jgi:hypothetical protein
MSKSQNTAAFRQGALFFLVTGLAGALLQTTLQEPGSRALGFVPDLYIILIIYLA